MRRTWVFSRKLGSSVLTVLTPGKIGIEYFRQVAAIVNAGGLPDPAKIREVMLRHGLVPA